MSGKLIDEHSKKRGYGACSQPHSGKYKRLPNGDDEDADTDINGKATKKQRTLFGFPIQVFFILGNEFCERFSFYGMSAILVIYLTSDMVGMNGPDATITYHAFNMICYTSPILGGILADNYLGAYKTILYVSIFYALGNIIVSVTAIPNLYDHLKRAGPLVGLFVIAVATGGIKPCVSVLGGNQFEAGQEENLSRFFAYFYLSINIGSLISMLLTPVLREDVHCFGTDSCYPLAFGVPAILMITSFILFLMGTPLYKRKPADKNMVLTVLSAVASAIKNRLKDCGSGIRKNHWIEWASDKYSDALKSDIISLLSVLFLFLPMPVFWTLHDQMSSTMVLQAEGMNGDMGKLGTFKPDQMQAINPLLVIIFIPALENVVYPAARKCGYNIRPLQRIGTGMVLVIVSFILSGIVQTKMDDYGKLTDVPAPDQNHANYRFINALPCNITLHSKNLTNDHIFLPQNQATKYLQVPIGFNLSVISECTSNQTTPDVKVTGGNSYTLIIGKNNSQMAAIPLSDGQLKPVTGKAKVRFFYAGGGSLFTGVNVTMKADNNDKSPPYLYPFSPSNYTEVHPDKYNVNIKVNGKNTKILEKNIDMTFKTGGIYTVVIDTASNEITAHMYTGAMQQTISIFWQVPQYFFITLGEVLFCATGYEFSYAEAPVSMKSCIMAAYLATTAVGNLIIIIIEATTGTHGTPLEYYIYAILLAVATFIFIVMAKFYKYQHNGPYQNGDLPQGDDDDELRDDGEDSGFDHEDNANETNAKINKDEMKGVC